VGEESDVIQQLLYFLALATFLMMGGLEAIFLSTLRSFEYVGAGVFLEGGSTLPILLGMVLGATEIGMRVALPLLGVVFLETVAMGFVSKTVPQLNVLSLGFPLRIMIGLVMMIAGLAVIDAVAAEWVGTVLDQIHIWATTPPLPAGGGI
jgi:flagellar biosynthesis protein FliR